MRHSPQQAEVPYFYDPTLAGVLPEAEAHHARQTLRLHTGDLIRVADGRGRTLTARLTDASPKGPAAYEPVHESIGGTMGPGETYRLPGPIVALCPVLKQPDRMEWLTEKLQELGTVRHLAWISYDRDQARRAPAMDRLQRLAVTALKQAHSPWLMAQTHHRGLSSAWDALPGLLSKLGHGDMRTTFGYLGPQIASTPLTAWAPKLPLGPLWVTVLGPEADFSTAELSFLSETCQGQAVSLGPSRLRAETAALVLNAYLSLSIADPN